MISYIKKKWDVGKDSIAIGGCRKRLVRLDNRSHAAIKHRLQIRSCTVTLYLILNSIEVWVAAAVPIVVQTWNKTM